LFRAEDYPDLLVGLAKADDAAVYRLSDELAVIQTLDFFTPVVDDPYQYGAIAAANAVSDVYAMDAAVIGEILRGGAENLSQTKPLGAGIITTALKSSVADAAHVRGAVESMMTLNRRAARLAQKVNVHAATDVTGLGLLGHSSEMANLSGVGLRFHLSQLPFLDGARDYAEQWLFPGGANRNQEYFACGVRFADGISDAIRLLLFTPETSGGLLLAAPPENVQALVALSAAEGQPCWLIGEVMQGAGIQVVE
jgi:selenide,water dikinase